MTGRIGPALVALLLVGCTEVTTELVPSAEAASAGDAAAGDAAAGDGGSRPGDARTRALCGESPCECDNGADDDGDALLDGFDPECSGALDDDENSFGTGAASPPLEACRDCFWDANATAQDDSCRYDVECLTSAMPAGPGSVGCGGCNPSGRCANICLPLTPNGCDCFGCCQQRASDGSLVYVQYIEGCSTSDVDDAQRCPRCEPRLACMNTCGVCELCGDRKRRDLPPECRAGADTVATHVCEEGEAVCTESVPCAQDFYCLLGCCKPVMVL